MVKELVPKQTSHYSRKFTVMIAQWVCPHCATRFEDHNNHAMEHDAICRHMSLLTPRQIKNIIKASGLTFSSFAAVTGISEGTIRDWINRENMQVRAYDNYLRLIGHKGSIRKLAALLESRSKPVQHVLVPPEDFDDDDDNQGEN